MLSFIYSQQIIFFIVSGQQRSISSLTVVCCCPDMYLSTTLSRKMVIELAVGTRPGLYLGAPLSLNRQKVIIAI